MWARKHSCFDLAYQPKLWPMKTKICHHRGGDAAHVALWACVLSPSTNGPAAELLDPQPATATAPSATTRPAAGLLPHPPAATTVTPAAGLVVAEGAVAVAG